MVDQTGFSFDFTSAEIIRLPSGKRRRSHPNCRGSLTIFPPARRKGFIDQVAQEILALPDDHRTAEWQTRVYDLSDQLRELGVSREKIRPLLLDFKLAVQARIHELASEQFCRPRSA